MKNLNELQHFVLVVQLRSFTAAAQQLGLPKSSVSRAISSLEERLGIQLLLRSTRSVKLTEAGKLYYRLCHKVLEDAEAAEAALSAMQAVPKGALHISTSIGFARFVLGPRMAKFLRKYPELDVHIHMQDDTQEPLQDGADVAICVGPLADSGWLMRSLMKVPLGLFAAPSLLQSHGHLKSLTDLASAPCIVSTCNRSAQREGHALWKLQRKQEVREVEVRARIAVTDPAMHRQLALEGLGVARLTEAEAQHDTRKRSLIRVLPEWRPADLELFALHPSRFAESPKVQAFLAFFGS